MIAVDTNILVYVHREDSPWHAPASKKLAELAESGRPWAIPWPSIHEFVAIVTHPRIFRPPTPLADAILQVECWLECPSLILLGEELDYWAVLKETMIAGKVAGPLVHDAHLAALCRLHGITKLWTADRDFGRFAGLPVVNPLVSR